MDIIVSVPDKKILLGSVNYRERIESLTCIPGLPKMRQNYTTFAGKKTNNKRAHFVVSFWSLLILVISF